MRQKISRENVQLRSFVIIGLICLPNAQSSSAFHILTSGNPTACLNETDENLDRMDWMSQALGLLTVEC